MSNWEEVPKDPHYGGSQPAMSGWERVTDDQSHVWQMYVFEVNRQARTCKAACIQTLELGDRLRTGQRMEPGDLEKLGEWVEQAISRAASLRNLIFGGAGPRDKELKPFWEDRIRWIQELMDRPDLPTIKNVSARNSLEHFDERMDAWAHAWAHRPDGESGWTGAFDCIVPSRGIWGGADQSKQLVRCYIADEAKFVVRSDEVHIPTLAKEATTIINRTRRFAAVHTTMWKSSGAAPQLIVPL